MVIKITGDMSLGAIAASLQSAIKDKGNSEAKVEYKDGRFNITGLDVYKRQVWGWQWTSIPEDTTSWKGLLRIHRRVNGWWNMHRIMVLSCGMGRIRRILPESSMSPGITAM